MIHEGHKTKDKEAYPHFGFVVGIEAVRYHTNRTESRKSWGFWPPKVAFCGQTRKAAPSPRCDASVPLRPRVTANAIRSLCPRSSSFHLAVVEVLA